MLNFFGEGMEHLKWALNSTDGRLIVGTTLHVRTTTEVHIKKRRMRSDFCLHRDGQGHPVLAKDGGPCIPFTRGILCVSCCSVSKKT